MLLWIALVTLSLLVLLALLRPLLGKPSEVLSGEDREVYAAQLKELEADRARGLLSESDAEVARVEIARRLLRAARARTDKPARSDRRWGAAAVAVAACALSLGGYLLIGSPGHPDQPLEARLAPVTDDELRQMVADAEGKLERNPSDGAGWLAIAPAYIRLQRFSDAAEAYRRAGELLGESATSLTGEAESLTFAAAGAVGPRAKSLFERALDLEPEARRPRIFLAIEARQRGDYQAAGERWRALIERSDGTEPWLQIAAQEFMRMGEGGAGSPVAPQAAAPQAAPADRAPGPTREAATAAGALPDEARRTMIEGMVARLAGRLSEEGGSVEEWMRLIRSYRVLGRDGEAEAALAEALDALPEREAARLRASLDDAQGVVR